MPLFHVLVRRSGPQWRQGADLETQLGWDEHARFMDALVEDGVILLGGPLADEMRVVHVVSAPSEDAVREILSRDPWSGSHLVVEEVTAWTVRLDGLHVTR